MLIAHQEDADRPRSDMTTGKGRLFEQHEGIQRVAVAGQGAGDVPVILGVPGGGEQHPVQPDLPGLVVGLVLVTGALGDLDDDLYVHRLHGRPGAMPSNPAVQAPVVQVPVVQVPVVQAPAVHMAGRRGQVVVVGSLNIDHVITVDQLPRPGETVSGHGYMAVPGGKGLNQAVTAARQGANVVMVGCVGDDTSGERLLQVLNDERIEAHSARRVAGVPSGTALITVATGGANTIVVAAGANHELGLADVEQAGGYFRPGVVALAQLEVPVPAVTAAFSLARAQGTTTLLNPAPAPGQLPRELLGLVDVITPNETEALAITGTSSPEKAAAWFLDRGCGSVALTLGERGALLARPGLPPVLVPTHQVKVVDTTAAGDAFCGSLASALAAGAALDDGVRYGCAAGALATTVMGALPSLPTAAQVERLMAGATTVGSRGLVR